MKKLAILFSFVILVVTLTGCVPGARNNNVGPSGDLVLPTKAGETSGTTELDIPDISHKDFKDDIAGLCEYLEKSYAVYGDKVQMSYDVIDAKDGYRYLFRYNKATVQVEVYEYDLENLSESAKTILENAKNDGKITIVDKEVEAVLSDNGKYLMIYQDSNAEESNKEQKERVIGLFKAFHA